VPRVIKDSCPNTKFICVSESYVPLVEPKYDSVPHEAGPENLENPPKVAKYFL
jgi:hypothetical protein